MRGISAIDYKLPANVMQCFLRMLESSKMKEINHPHLFQNVFGCMIYYSVSVIGGNKHISEFCVFGKLAVYLPSARI